MEEEEGLYLLSASNSGWRGVEEWVVPPPGVEIGGDGGGSKSRGSGVEDGSCFSGVKIGVNRASTRRNRGDSGCSEATRKVLPGDSIAVSGGAIGLGSFLTTTGFNEEAPPTAVFLMGAAPFFLVVGSLPFRFIVSVHH